MYYDYIVMFEHLFSERGLSLDRLKTLIEVARAGSIAGAARGDSARQSLYSRQIKELEEFFGVELTRRRGKVLVLTRPGWELVRRAHESLCLLDDFKSRSRNMPYRFTIGAGDSLHAWIAAPALAEMQKRGLPWLFALQNLRNSDVPLKLQNMDVDFGIVRTSALAAEGLESRVIQTMDYALYVPAALAGKGTSGTSADFPRLMETLPLATLAGGSGFYASLKRSCMEYGIDLRVQCETQSFPFAARMLKSGAFMAILPCMAEEELGKGFFKVTHPALDRLARSISLAWNPRLLRVRPSAGKVIEAFAVPGQV